MKFHYATWLAFFIHLSIHTMWLTESTNVTLMFMKRSCKAYMGHMLYLLSVELHGNWWLIQFSQRRNIQLVSIQCWSCNIPKIIEIKCCQWNPNGNSFLVNIHIEMFRMNFLLYHFGSFSVKKFYFLSSSSSILFGSIPWYFPLDFIQNGLN